MFLQTIRIDLGKKGGLRAVFFLCKPLSQIDLLPEQVGRLDQTEQGLER